MAGTIRNRPFVVAVDALTVTVEAPCALAAFIAAYEAGLVPIGTEHLTVIAADRPLS